jgi:hypothetical protein
LSPLLLSLSLAFAHGAGAHECADVYDRTEGCVAPDAAGLALAPDALPAAAAETPEVDGFGWRLLAASGVASVLGVALTGATFAYDAHLAALRQAGTVTTQSVERVLTERAVVGWSAVAAYTGAGLLLASSGAFFIFDPARGQARAAFRIEGE